LIVGGLVIGAVGSWRLTFLIVGLPGLLAALLVFTIKEPARKNLLDGKASKLIRSDSWAVSAGLFQRLSL
jgi:predicted MFS family arabinose efflux permease